MPRRPSTPAPAIACLALVLALVGCRNDNNRSGNRPRQLAALPYFAKTPVAPRDVGKRGVTVHRDEARDGINVYCSEARDEFELRDMDGAVLKRVPLPGYCRLVKPLGAGFLVLHGIAGEKRTDKTETLSRLRWNGEVVWSNAGGHHHDFDVVGDRIFVLSSRFVDADFGPRTLPAILNPVTVIDASTGETVGHYRLHEMLAPMVKARALDRLERDVAAGNRHGLQTSADLYHVNALEALEPRGDLRFLIASRSLDLVAIVDLDDRELLWRSPIKLDGPHDPSRLADGTILVFDNGRRRGWSRILRIDPDTREVVWRYASGPAFFSASKGSVQLLPGGNVLIGEADRGRSFELTPDKTVAWEFWSEDRIENSRHVRLTIYRADRWFEDAIDSDAYRALWREAFADRRAQSKRLETSRVQP